MEDDWNQVADPTDEELANQLTGDSQDALKQLSQIAGKVLSDAASKYGVTDVEAFNKRRELASVLLKKGDDADAEEATSEHVDDSTQANGCRPWVGAIKAPSWYKKDPNLSNPPNVKVDLSWVHGYRSKDCRNNVRLIGNNEVIYNAAGVAVILDFKNKTQRYFNDHTDDVTAITVNKEGSLVATGQVSDTKKNCPIFIWNPETMQVVQKIRDAASKGCALLSFSPDGTKLVSLSINDDHDIAVIDVKSGQVIKKVSGGPDKLFSAKWRDDNIIVTAGEKHLRLWNLQEGLTFKRGLWGANKCSSRIIGMTINPVSKDIVLGAADGTVQIFKMNQCQKVIPLHGNKIVDALNFSNGYLLTGGRDATICILSATNYGLLQRIDAAKLFGESSVSPKIRSLQFNSDCSELFVSTFGSEIFQLRLTKSGDTFNVTAFKQILAGHYSPNGSYTNEVWGLDLVGTRNPDLYTTVSDDATIRIWSLNSKKQIKSANLNVNSKGEQNPLDTKNGNDYTDSAKARSVAVSPLDGSFVVGFKDGTVRVLDESLKLQKVFKHAKEWISSVKFSPSGNLLAIGSHDNTIYMYDYPSLQLKQKLSKHTSFITHIDFSADGNYLRSVCGAYDLLFWDLQNFSHLTSGATVLRDAEWFSNSAIFAWPVQKMWKKSYNDYTDINYVDRSHSKINGDYILANGDDYSMLNLYKWPCVNANAKCIEADGHSSHITNVRFSLDDKYIISTGGEDNSVFVWKVTPL